MKYLISLVLVFSYAVILGVKVNGGIQQISKYAGGEFDYQAAVLTGGLVPDGLVVLFDSKTGLNGLYVVQNHGYQDAVNPQATYDPSLAENIKLIDN